MNSIRTFAFVVAGSLAACAARADITYQIETFPFTTSETFNNSAGTETEDCWVANSFQVIAGGTHITQIQFGSGAALTARSVTVTLYTGGSLTSAAGLTRLPLSTTTTSVTALAGALVSISLANPIDLLVGQVFYAAVLMPAVPGNLFPFTSDAGSPGAPAPLGRSFFDVGATQGAAYNLDVTTRATVLGGNHPVVGLAQSPGNAVIRAVAVPGPGGAVLAGVAGLGLIRRKRRA